MLDGFTYTILKSGQLDSQLTFAVSSYERYRGWCGLQHAHPTGWTEGGEPFGAYYCSPGGWDQYSGGVLNGDCTVRKGTTTVTLSAAQCTLCSVVGMAVGKCACDSCHCTALMASTEKISLTFSGDTASGKIEHDLGGPVSKNPDILHFTRVKP